MIKPISEPSTGDRHKHSTTHCRETLPSKRIGTIAKSLLLALLGIIAGVILWGTITRYFMQQREEVQAIITENNLHAFISELHNLHGGLGEFPTREEFIQNQVAPGLVEKLDQSCVIRWDALPESFREIPEGVDLDTILVAYEKKTKTEGGLVSFLDNTTEELTPEEFSPFLAAANERAERNQAEAVEDD